MTDIVVYTDLDGTLLDHDDYSHAPADALLAELEADGIPVVACTSKTRAELVPLREELHNRHPFIVENGAAVFMRAGYFDTRPPDAEERDGLWIRTFVRARPHWLQLLREVGAAFAGEFSHFAAMDDHEIARLTGLDEEAAARAARREFGEPVQWHGSRARRDAFVAALHAAGARVLRGGRFLHVSGDCDKGLALNWLHAQFTAEGGQRPPISIAAGDSPNDIAMLEAADYALIVRSPVQPLPGLPRHRRAYVSAADGPSGWDEGLRRILKAIQADRR